MAGNYSDALTGPYGTGDPLGVRTRNLTVVEYPDSGIDITADNHAFLYRMQYINPDSRIPIVVNVGDSVSMASGTPEVQKASCIIFTQESDNPLLFEPREGITIITPGKLTAYGKGSTVTLISLDEKVWVLGGDVEPSDVVV